MKELSSTATDILAHTHSLIIQGGYSGFSYADIAGRIGIRKASIHHHFPTKADLVQILVARYREEARDGMAEMERRNPDPIRLLQQYIGYWETCILDATAPFCVCALLASELPRLPENVAAEVKTHFRDLASWLASVLERGARQGILQLADAPRIEAEAFMAVVHGAMLSARAYGDPKIFGSIMQPVLDRFSPGK